jgi:hypothetical protein
VTSGRSTTVGGAASGVTLDVGDVALVPRLTGVTAAAAGEHDSCAAVAAGEVRCWGDTAFGQRGDGTIETRLRPLAVIDP